MVVGLEFDGNGNGKFLVLEVPVTVIGGGTGGTGGTGTDEFLVLLIPFS